MNLYLVRHGRTDWNVARKLQGRDDAPLNALGIEDAYDVKERLAAVEVSLLYSSPLSRALDTARILNQTRTLPIQIDARLIERDYGALSGCNVEANQALVAAESAPGFEKSAAIQARIASFFQEQIFPSDADSILIVSHAIAIRFILSYLQAEPLPRYVDHRDVHHIILRDHRIVRQSRL